MTTLDIVSKGRIILGGGVGYQACVISRAFRLPVKEHRAALFEEGVDIYPQALERSAIFLSQGALHVGHTSRRRPPAVPDASAASVYLGGVSVPAAVRRAGCLVLQRGFTPVGEGSAIRRLRCER